MIARILAPDIGEMLDLKQNQEARSALLELMNPEVADVLMTLEPRHRIMAFRLLPRDRAADVFTFLEAEQQEQLLGELNSQDLAQVFNEMSPDDRAQLFEEMPGECAARLLTVLKPEERKQTQIILGYPAESIGRLMTPDYIAVRPEWSAQQALDHVRKHGRDAETINVMYVVDQRGKLIDDIRLRQILLVDPNTPIQQLMDNQFVSLNATDDREVAVRAMERYDRAALPVLGSDGVLVGIVTFDDVADVAQAEATEDIQKLGGVEALDMPYMTVGLGELLRKRGLWLSMLFLGEMLTATAMGHYQSEIDRVSDLALFVPLIISSGGNSGSQAVTLIIRAMALGELRLRDWGRVLLRELACGAALGLLLGLIGFARIHLWASLGFSNYHADYHLLAMTVFTSLIGVVLWGTIMGSMLPFLLRAMRLDPATVSSPLVATLVDVTGLIIYFTMAMLILGLGKGG